MHKGAFHLPIGDGSGRGPPHDHDVQTAFEQMLLQSIAFFDEPFHTVPYHTVPDSPADGYAEKVLPLIIFRYIHHKILVGSRSAVLVNFLKLPVLA